MFGAARSGEKKPSAQGSCRRNRSFEKADADRLVHLDHLARVHQQPRLLIPSKNLDAMAVAASRQQIPSAGGERKAARMNAGRLITYSGQRPVLRIDLKDGDAVRFQPVGSVQEPPVGRKLNIRTSSGMQGIRFEILLRRQLSVGIIEYDDIPRQFVNQVSIAPVRMEDEVSRPVPRLYLYVRHAVRFY